MAFAAAKFATAMLEALNGLEGKVECAYVRSEETEAKYFATPILLGVRFNSSLVFLQFITILIIYENHNNNDR